VDVSAIVLAGGRSSRFGRDKLGERLGHGTVLEQTIATVQAVATDVVVVAAAGGTPAVPDGVRLAHDPLPDGGPLIGALAGLEVAQHEVVIVVGGDMPWLVVGVLQALVNALAGDATAAALESDGRIQQLPIAVRREASAAAVGVLIAAGTRRLGALSDVLAIEVIPEATWRALDPEGASLRDIDEPGDLPPS
jgi:molybdopterin-guanine dinucleotide biosynthesis protein A